MREQLLNGLGVLLGLGFVGLVAFVVLGGLYVLARALWRTIAG